MNIQETIISQYFATLEMLKQAVTACPEAAWATPGDHNKFSQVAYHALLYTHLYLQESPEAFQYWPGHHEKYRLSGDATTDPADVATKETVLGYLAFCQEQVVEKAATMAFEGPAGFHWLKFNKLELQFYSIRHVQHHVGELMERLGAQGIELDWIASYPAERRNL
jgi:hypothetical protein